MQILKVMILLGIAALSAPALAQGVGEPGRAARAAAPKAAERANAIDSKEMEKDLQGLPWPKFRSIVEQVPKLRAQVEAYGTAGWPIVQANYTRYRWHRNIDKLDDEQKRQLAELIRAAKAGR